jgi:hypothetical protein
MKVILHPDLSPFKIRGEHQTDKQGLSQFRLDLSLLFRVIAPFRVTLVLCSDDPIEDAIDRWISDAENVLKGLPGSLEHLSPSERRSSEKTFKFTVDALRTFEDEVNEAVAAMKAALASVGEPSDAAWLERKAADLLSVTTSLFTSAASGPSGASGSNKRPFDSVVGLERTEPASSETGSVIVPKSTLEGMLAKLRSGTTDVDGLQEDIQRMLTMSAASDASDEPESKRSRITVVDSIGGGSEM